MKNKAIFIDRDGVINEICYHHDIGIYSAKNLGEFKLIKGVKEGISEMKKMGFLVVVISNQPGVDYGAIKMEDLDKMDQYMMDELGITKVYNCTHHPHHSGDCDCRKPKQGLLLKAAEELQIDISQSYMVGDNATDIQMGKNCKKTVYVGKTQADILSYFREINVHPDVIVKNLIEAAKKINELEHQ